MSTVNPALSGKPVPSFFKILIPSVLGILAMSMASVVDGIFIGRHEGSEALAAVNLIIPVFSITYGLSYMLAIGGSISAGKSVGEGNFLQASNIFSKTLIATLIYGLILVVSGVLGSQYLFELLGAKPELLQPMNDYFGTLIWFIPIQVATAAYYFFVRIAGYPKLASTALIVGAASNLILDWLLIGQLNYGLTGAALATGISYMLTISIMLLYLCKPDRWLTFIPQQKNWRELLRSSFNGLSEFINEISAGVVTFILNLVIIHKLGVEGVAAFSIVSYSLFIGLLLSFSIADALQVLCSQCYGARNQQRLKQFVTIATLLILINAMGFIALLVTQAEPLIRLFIIDSDSSLITIATGFIYVLWPVFIFNGLNVVISAYLTATHKAMASATIALLRSLILPLALLFILTQFFPQWPFLLAITGAEALTLIMAFWLYVQYRPDRLLNDADQPLGYSP